MGRLEKNMWANHCINQVINDEVLFFSDISQNFSTSRSKIYNPQKYVPGSPFVVFRNQSIFPHYSIYFTGTIDFMYKS